MDIVANFDIHFEQYLDKDASLTQALPNNIDAKQCIAFYRVMTLIRRFDQKAINLQRTGKMGTYASILGQEAISTALGAAMEKEDVLAPFYRDYAAMYQRGVHLHEILTYWGGNEQGNCYQNNPHDFPISVPIASQCLHAAGAARAFQLQNKPQVAVATLGDGGTSEGDFYEALNVGGAWQLPLVILVNNNQWAISVPLHKQTACQTLAQKAIAAGVKGIQVDGNDVIATYQVICDALKHARDQHGPVLVEAMTYRLCDHTTADDASRYRDNAELEAAWEKEPINRLKHFLLESKYIDEQALSEIDKAIIQEVDEAVTHYLNLDKPPLEDMFDYHYAEMPDILSYQKKCAMAEEGSKTCQE